MSLVPACTLKLPSPAGPWELTVVTLSYLMAGVCILAGTWPQGSARPSIVIQGIMLFVQPHAKGGCLYMYLLRAIFRRFETGLVPDWLQPS